MARMNVLAEVAKGLKANIHAVDNLSPVSRVAVYIKAGSRYEPDEVPGVSHYVRAAAGLTTENSSVFGITRHCERAGASFKVTTDREYIIYRMDCLRDKLGYVLGFIDDTIHKPEFRTWELVDIVQPRMKEDLIRFRANQGLVTNEAVHKAAYRGGLAHSIFAPEHQITKIKKNHLLDFVEKNFVLERMSFVGLGVDENELRHIVEDKFALNGNPYKGVVGASRYVGGESRIQANYPETMINFVVQGGAIGDTKTIAALGVLGSILGGSSQRYIKYGDGPGKSLSSILSKISPTIKGSIININHSDSGLFGLSITGTGATLKEATKAAVQHMKTTISSVSENDLKTAKTSLKARAMINSENHDSAFENMARKFASGVQGAGAFEHIDKLTLKDVQAVASKLLKSKPSMAVVGNPRFVPYMDEMES